MSSPHIFKDFVKSYLNAVNEYNRTQGSAPGKQTNPSGLKNATGTKWAYIFVSRT